MRNNLLLPVPNAFRGVTNRFYWLTRHSVFVILTPLFIAFAPHEAFAAQEKEPTASPAHQQSTAPRFHIAVEGDRLTANLRDMDLREVLRQIEQQTKIAIHVSPNIKSSVSAEFTAVTLEEALRQLLQQTPFSYGIIYGHGPAGTVIIKSVHVVADGKQEATRPTGTTSAPAPSVRPEDSEAGRRLRKILQDAQQKALSEKGDSDKDAARRFRELIEKAQRSSQQDAPGAEIPRDLIDSLQGGGQAGQEPRQ